MIIVEHLDEYKYWQNCIGVYIVYGYMYMEENIMIF